MEKEPKIRRPLFKSGKISQRKQSDVPRSSNDTSAVSASHSCNAFGRPVKRHRSHNALVSSSLPTKISRRQDSNFPSIEVNPKGSYLVDDNSLNSVGKNELIVPSSEESTAKMLDNILFGTKSAEIDGAFLPVSSKQMFQVKDPSVSLESPIAAALRNPSETECKVPDDMSASFHDDILDGLCPEDLSLSFSNSSSVECARDFESKTDRFPLTVQTSTCKDLSKFTSVVNVDEECLSLNPCSFVKSGELLSNRPAEQFPERLNEANSNNGTFYGLPLRVKECLEEYRGIKQLYEWQHRCLSMPSVSNGENLIYSLPTSGGKTLVAEIIILKQLLLNSKDALLILPFVSIVQEKVRQLAPFSSVLGFAIEEFAASKGKLPPRQRHKKRVLYIATIEKANGLINSLLELGRIHNLGLVVIDELHMLGDGSSRGATLESCLAKLLYCSSGTQLVGMSATLGNMSEVAAFMKARVFSSNFRPVELVEQVKLGKCVYRIIIDSSTVNFDPIRNIRDDSHSQLDPDQLSSLVAEVVPHSSCLVFCPTKKSCQNVALLLTKTLPRNLRDVNQSGKQQLIKTLSLEAYGVCPTLAQTLPYGVAYHHSGLTADERKIIEEGYLEGTLCVIACTSTLAAGVNLPARRVILRSPYIGSQLMSRSQYKQMVGRAGRSGLCDAGESILILSQRDKDEVVSMLSGPYELCRSSLLSDGGVILLSLLLNIIGLKIVRSFSDVQNFFKSTLLFTQFENIDDKCRDALTKLITIGHITIETSENSNESSYQITTLGRATFKGCLAVDLANVIYRELKDSLQMMVLSTDLHLLYLATPISLSTSIQPNWTVYFQEVTGLQEDELKIAELLGIKPGYLMGRATGSGRGALSSEVQQFYHRFYITLILHSLLKLTAFETMWKVADRFHCSRGFLQSVMHSTASHVACLVMFTAELPVLWPLHLLLPAVFKKLAYSAHLELIPLMEVPGIKQGRARQLVTAGITTPHQLASSDPSKLVEHVDNLFPKQARDLIQAAKALLAEQAEALFEEAEELMTMGPTDSIFA